MEVVYSLAGIIIAVVGAYYLMLRARAEKTIAELMVLPKEEQIRELQEIAQLEQEIKDGKIDYAAARTKLNELRARADQLQRP